MNEIPREHATSQLDMPHAALIAETGTCRCGRREADPIHQDEALPEIASAQDATLVRETGS
jgi:hypothetical protein